jgi:hypothetical protein
MILHVSRKNIRCSIRIHVALTHVAVAVRCSLEHPVYVLILPAYVCEPAACP